MFNSVSLQAFEQAMSFMRHGDSRLRYPGPVKWCHMCHRRHPARACRLVQDTRIAKSGREVTRWVHPEAKIESKKKTKARKS